MQIEKFTATVSDAEKELIQSIVDVDGEEHKKKLLIDWDYYSGAPYRRFIDSGYEFRGFGPASVVSKLKTLYTKVHRAVENSVHFTMRNYIGFSVGDEALEKKITDVLDANRFQSAKYKFGRYAAAGGTAFIKVARSPQTGNIRIVLPPPEYVDILSNWDDVDEVLGYREKYGDTMHVITADTISLFERQVEDGSWRQVGPSAVNETHHLPIVVKQLDLGGQYGENTFYHVKDVLDNVNAVSSLVFSIIKDWADPLFFAKGMNLGNLDRETQNTVSTANKDADLKMVGWDGSFADTLKFIEDIAGTIEEDMPELSVPKLMNNDWSGDAMERAMTELTSKIDETRGNMEQGFSEMVIQVAQLLGVEGLVVDDVTVQWDPIIAPDKMEEKKLVLLEQKQGLIGQKFALKQLGFSDQEIVDVTTETDEVKQQELDVMEQARKAEEKRLNAQGGTVPQLDENGAEVGAKTAKKLPPPESGKVVIPGTVKKAW
jgi:hypothetical protein